MTPDADSNRLEPLPRLGFLEIWDLGFGIRDLPSHPADFTRDYTNDLIADADDQRPRRVDSLRTAQA